MTAVSTPAIMRSIRSVVFLTTLLTVRSASETISDDVFLATKIAIAAKNTITAATMLNVDLISALITKTAGDVCFVPGRTCG